MTRTLPGKAYRAEGVTVFFDARRCLHVAECVRGLPGVFDPDVRPWIQPQNAAAEAVAEVVRRCPTGALHYALTSTPISDSNSEPTSGNDEVGDDETRITPQPDGPLFVRGRLSVATPQGDMKETRAALCRCGASGNKPFCDGTHSKIDWRSGAD